MRDLIIKMLILIVGFAVGMMLADIIDICKIKCFCNHTWELEWLWYNTGEACLKCKKCGKRKKLTISVKSFEKMLVNKKGNFRWEKVESKYETD